MKLFIFNRETGKYIATWKQTGDEKPPSAYEAWDYLKAAFPVVIVTDSGELHSQWPN